MKLIFNLERFESKLLNLIIRADTTAHCDLNGKLAMHYLNHAEKDYCNVLPFLPKQTLMNNFNI